MVETKNLFLKELKAIYEKKKSLLERVKEEGVILTAPDGSLIKSTSLDSPLDELLRREDADETLYSRDGGITGTTTSPEGIENSTDGANP